MEFEYADCPRCGCRMSRTPNPAWLRKWSKWRLFGRLLDQDQQSVWICSYCHAKVVGKPSAVPSEPDPDILRAIQHLKAQEWREASANYDRVLGRKPNSLDAWLGKGLAEAALWASTRWPAPMEQRSARAVRCFEQAMALAECNTAMPSEFELYQAILAELPAPRSVDRHANVIKALLQCCSKEVGPTGNPPDSNQILALSEYYYALARHLDPDLGTDPWKHEDSKEALKALARRAAHAGLWDKVAQYNGVWSEPRMQVWHFIDWNVKTYGWWEQLAPLVIDSPDEAAVIIRGTVRDTHRVIRVGSGEFKRLPIDYIHDYSFQRLKGNARAEESYTRIDMAELGQTSVGCWRCEEDIAVYNPRKSEEVAALSLWGEPATELDSIKVDLLSVIDTAYRDGPQARTEEQRCLLVGRLSDLERSGVLSPVEVAGALTEYDERDAAKQYLQEKLDDGSIDWSAVEKHFSYYQTGLRKPRHPRREECD